MSNIDFFTAVDEHRTYREFTDERLSPETLEKLKHVAQRTATSSGLQLSSIIEIEDPQLRKQVAEIGKQEYISRAPHLWLFIVDANRAAQIITENGGDQGALAGAASMDFFFQGFTDAILTAQNVSSACEVLGLGSAFLGSPLNDPAALCKVLDLPQLIFPALALMFGHPNQSPQLKPRMSMDYRFFTDRYSAPESMREALAGYDAEMLNYYDTRATNRKTTTFTQQLVSRAGVVLPARRKFLEAIRDQGFDLDI